MSKILTEASGSLTSGFLIKAIQQAGHKAVASDVMEDIAAKVLADDFILMPSKNDPELWPKIQRLLTIHQINMVIPSLDETLILWAKKRNELRSTDLHVIISDEKTIETFQDKWKTYQFFTKNDIPTPKTSLEQVYPLVKPRHGRGAINVSVPSCNIPMDGMISQELLQGEEYTIDLFCNRDAEPVYIVPRKRLQVRNGKSTGGEVVKANDMEVLVKKICKAIPLVGPINLQCFRCQDGSLKFTEINTRIAGGMALGFAATENWISIIIEHFCKGKPISPKPIQYGMKMMRYYAEVFVAPHEQDV